MILGISRDVGTLRRDQTSMVAQLQQHEGELEKLKTFIQELAVPPAFSSETGGGRVEKTALPPPPTNNNSSSKGVEKMAMPPPTSSEAPPSSFHKVEAHTTPLTHSNLNTPIRVRFENMASEAKPLQNEGTPSMYYTPTAQVLPGVTYTPYYTPVSCPHIPKSADLPLFSGGEDSTLDAEEWIFKAEQRMLLEDTPSDKQVTWAGFHLDGYALSWWRTTKEDPTHKAKLLTKGWNYFKKVFLLEHLRLNKESVARDSFDEMRQQGKTVVAYTAEFRDTICHLPDLSEKSKVHKYVKGLCEPMKTDIQPQIILQELQEDLSAVISIAEGWRDLLKYATHTKNQRQQQKKPQ